MAALGQQVTIGTTATLIFEVVDAVTYAGLTNPAANIFKAREPSDPLPLEIFIPANVYLGGSNVTASSTNIGAETPSATQISYNVTGSDSLYGVVASSTTTVQLLAMRQ